MGLVGSKLSSVKKYNIFALLLKCGGSVDDAVQIRGSLSGYTALHIACLENNKDLVRLLIKECNANVNAIADDGVQPIHSATLLEHTAIVRILLENNANPDAKISQSIYLKYIKDVKWCSDFGDEMTLLTFALIYKKLGLAKLLIRYNASIKVKSLTNKTLLMYAVEGHCDKIVEGIVKKLTPEEINARDDDGVPATHYLLHEKLYGDFRYDYKQMGILLLLKRYILQTLIDHGADVSATINGDSSTLLINMAAYRASPSMLSLLLFDKTSFVKSEALYYVTYKDESPLNTYRLHYGISRQPCQQAIELQKKCIQIIIRDLIVRQYFNFPVLEKELTLMQELIEKDTTVKTFVQDYNSRIIEGCLKKKRFFGDLWISGEEIIKMSNNVEKLAMIINDKFLVAIKEFFALNNELLDYYILIYPRVCKFKKRKELMNKCIDILSCKASLSYIPSLCIVCQLKNVDLKNFIIAFNEETYQVL